MKKSEVRGGTAVVELDEDKELFFFPSQTLLLLLIGINAVDLAYGLELVIMHTQVC